MNTFPSSEDAKASDNVRFLVEWPWLRGMKKEELKRKIGLIESYRQ